MNEGNDMGCPVCEKEGRHGIMVYTSDGFFKCVQCDYQRSAVKCVPTQAELLKEIERLKEEVEFYKKTWTETAKE